MFLTYLVCSCISLLLSHSFALTPTVRITGEWSACSGRSGVCINTDRFECSARTLTGLCPGPRSIRCCPAPGGVRSGACNSERLGVCTRSENCRRTPIRGKCPGPAAITCCPSGSTTPPPTASTPSPSRGEWALCRFRIGVCINTRSHRCSGTTLGGLCPGARNIRCCPYPAGVRDERCSSIGGVCARTENCQRTPTRGRCPGPSQVTCCPQLSLAPTPRCTLGAVSLDPAAFGAANECSTKVVDGLTRQLLSELNRMGISFSRLADQSRFRCRSPCQPFLQTDARNSLAEATRSRRDFITLNSAYRSSAQQFLLFQWSKRRLCGIRLAARPGTSNHEGGLAIDVRSFNSWRPTLMRFSWRWFGRRDPVHFDFTGGGRRGISRESLRAFQRLWNRNNPSDKITDDGRYGRQTEMRMMRTPCEGW